MYSTDRKGNGKAKGRPGLKWLDTIQMTDLLVSQVYQEEKGNGKTKRRRNRRKIIKDPKNISADVETEFVLTAVYRTITNAMNSKGKCMKRVFRRNFGTIL